ncbi:MAG: hypothetical protein IH789_07390 [Acidobacteria bacterium]|nr:hypothetical protein [Acidobacteriota bacterium]
MEWKAGSPGGGAETQQRKLQRQPAMMQTTLSSESSPASLTWQSKISQGKNIKPPAPWSIHEVEWKKKKTLNGIRVIEPILAPRGNKGASSSYLEMEGLGLSDAAGG